MFSRKQICSQVSEKENESGIINDFQLLSIVFHAIFKKQLWPTLPYFANKESFIIEKNNSEKQDIFTAIEFFLNSDKSSKNIFSKGVGSIS